MDFGKKLQKLREEKGWTIRQVTKMIGTSESQYWRWVYWSESEEAAEKFAKLADMQATEPRAGRKKAAVAKVKKEAGTKTIRGSRLAAIELIKLSEIFDVDVQWLIDDRKGWEERPKLVGPIADRFKQLTPVEALSLWEIWTSAKQAAKAAKQNGRPHP